MHRWKWRHICALALWTAAGALAYGQTIQIGREVAISKHLQDGEEFLTSLTILLNFGKDLFTANWTRSKLLHGSALAQSKSSPKSRVGSSGTLLAVQECSPSRSDLSL